MNKIACALLNMYDFNSNPRFITRLVSRFFTEVDPDVETFFPLLPSYYKTK